MTNLPSRPLPGWRRTCVVVAVAVGAAAIPGPLSPQVLSDPAAVEVPGAAEGAAPAEGLKVSEGGAPAEAGAPGGSTGPLTPTEAAAAQVEGREGMAFLVEAFRDHQVVLLGNTHRHTEILGFESRAVAELARRGTITHLGVEIAADQQRALDRFFETGRGLDQIQVAPAIDHPAFRDFLVAIRPLSHPAGGSLRVVALDRPWSGNQEGTRDAHMASRIASALERVPRGRMLVQVGNNHALRDFPWRWGGDARFIPGELNALRPDLRVMSIHECVDTGAPTELRLVLGANLPDSEGPVAVGLKGDLGALPDDSVTHLNSAPGVTPGSLQDAVLFYRNRPALLPVAHAAEDGASVDADGTPNP